MTFSDYRSPSEPIFKMLQLLKFSDIVKFRPLNLSFNVKNNYFNQYFVITQLLSNLSTSILQDRVLIVNLCKLCKYWSNSMVEKQSNLMVFSGGTLFLLI